MSRQRAWLWVAGAFWLGGTLCTFFATAMWHGGSFPWMLAVAVGLPLLVGLAAIILVAAILNLLTLLSWLVFDPLCSEAKRRTGDWMERQRETSQNLRFAKRRQREDSE